MEYALNLKGQLKQLFLIHGEPDAAGALREKLVAGGLDRISYPERGESVEL